MLMESKCIQLFFRLITAVYESFQRSFQIFSEQLLERPTRSAGSFHFPSFHTKMIFTQKHGLIFLTIQDVFKTSTRALDFPQEVVRTCLETYVHSS